jgi:thiol-disulfide isomerase/thioredoxin
MPFRSWFAAAFAALSLASMSLTATAAEPRPYDAQAFAAAQAAGKPILIEVDASWCPTCAQQRPILAELEKSAELSDLVVFTVDFDSRKDVLRQFRVQMQSTLIVFHGKTEKGRSTGETDAGAIKALLMRAKSA